MGLVCKEFAKHYHISLEKCGYSCVMKYFGFILDKYTVQFYLILIEIENNWFFYKKISSIIKT